MKKSSLTCSAAPRFKTVTASLGHSFVLPTWKLIHRVHMTRKTSFCPLGQKLVFSSEACLAAREAPAGVSSTLPLTSRSARSFTAAPPPLHLAPPTFTLRPAQTFTIKKEVLSCPTQTPPPVHGLRRLHHPPGQAPEIAAGIGRSGTSIGANIREAQYANSRADFISKLQIALKEANETGYWLELLFRTNYISEAEYQSLDSACTRIRVMLIASLNTAKAHTK